MSSTGRTYRKIVEKSGAARFYTPYHADFVTELKKFVPSKNRLWEGGSKYWWIDKESVDMATMIANRYFTPEGMNKRQGPPVYGDPDFTNFREGQAREHMRQRQDDFFGKGFSEFGRGFGKSEYAKEWANRQNEEAFRTGYEGFNHEAAEAERKRNEEARQKEEAAKRAYADEGQEFRDWFNTFKNSGPYSQFHEAGKPPVPPPNGRMTVSAAYQTLQVTQSACSEVVEAAYKALAKKHHPDLGGNVETMKSINQAYQMVRRK